MFIVLIIRFSYKLPNDAMFIETHSIISRKLYSNSLNIVN